MRKSVELIGSGVVCIVVFGAIGWAWYNGWIAVALWIIIPVLFVSGIVGAIGNHYKDKGYQKGWDEASEYYKDK